MYAIGVEFRARLIFRFILFPVGRIDFALDVTPESQF